jgi:predicted aspartyl protease
LDRYKGKSMKINIQFDLPFVEAAFSHKGREINVSNVLVDTGSASTLLSAEVALELGLEPELGDNIQTMRGVGGKEFVYEKNIDKLTIEFATIQKFTIQIGDMDYGMDINGIIGSDFLMATKTIIDMGAREMYVKS